MFYVALHRSGVFGADRLALELAWQFWADLDQHHPGIASLQQ